MSAGRRGRGPVVALRLAVLGLAAVLVATALPLPGPAGPAPAGADTWPMGSQPVDDVLYWAGQKAAERPECGLGQHQLAAIMLSVVPFEAGMTATRAPSPMTLGRWDTQDFAVGLYAFGDKATPYRRAYFHAGIGLWQFDSAGHYPLTAAGAINTWTAARQAATTMAQRWCSSSNPDVVERLKTTWGPWYACVGGNFARCLGIYQDLFDGAAIRWENLPRQASVTRTGGMEVRTCTLGQVRVTCHHVDPGKAEGYDDWAIPSYGGTQTAPITAPFYVIEHEGREHRYWLPEDTGYDVTVSADKPVTSNARSSLTWSTTRALCDETVGRGTCLPLGNLDSATGGAASITVRGWAFDPDTPGPTDVHVYVDGRFSGAWRADGHRPDVPVHYPVAGEDHGFEVTVNGVEAGTREVCTFMINLGPGWTSPLLACATVSVAPGPPGFWDVPPGHPFLEPIGWVKGAGISLGYDDGTYRPAELVSRGSMAAFLQRLHQALGGPPTTGPATFADVPPTHPFAAAIGWAQATGVAGGYGDGTYRPSAPVSRGAMAAFLARLHQALGGTVAGGTLPADVPADHPFAAAIAWAAGAGVATGYGDGSFRPGEPVTRQAMAAFLQRLAAVPR